MAQFSKFRNVSRLSGAHLIGDPVDGRRFLGKLWLLATAVVSVAVDLTDTVSSIGPRTASIRVFETARRCQGSLDKISSGVKTFNASMRTVTVLSTACGVMSIGKSLRAARYTAAKTSSASMTW
mmetsp:Transcript_13780/g.39106  ORF Transcript_13780/g.39106 Transcript_13780/m.39106 type:complete len:124 (+) Transcript_13780:557-928(+)